MDVIAFRRTFGVPCFALALLCATCVWGATPCAGPLRVHPTNPRYFSDASGRAIYLTGSHNWGNFQDRGIPQRPAFDYAAYLDFLQKHHHNFMRLWVWEGGASARDEETIRLVWEPMPYLRTGPGTAQDGKPKFDLHRFNPEYFHRLRERVKAAGDQGIYVSVMLFQGWSIERKTGSVSPWFAHPFNAVNNVNGVDGDANRDGEGSEVHTLAVPAVTRLQEAYVQKVVETLNDLDNVLYEVTNESPVATRQWQYHIVEFIKGCEMSRPKQHPAGISYFYNGRAGAMDALLASPADWISPGNDGGVYSYDYDPPAAEGRKVFLSDTDHFFGVGGDQKWVWRSFTRGLNVLFMDPLEDPKWEQRRQWEPARQAMGQTRELSDRIDMALMLPHPELASTRYCLADPSREYVVYLPEGGRVMVDLSPAPATFAVEWLRPTGAGAAVSGDAIQGGAKRSLQAPFGGDAVLHLTAKSRDLAPRERINTSDRAFIPPGRTVYLMRDKTVCAIDDRLFGQFMERPSWGETGVEGAVVPGTNRLQPEALRLLAELHMPIVRFPGGTDVDFMDWRDMVNNVPGRGPERPVSMGHTGKSVTNRFGYDEFLGLCRDLKAEPILVVNFQDALLRRKPAKEAAFHAAALVAYANAPQGAALPDGMIDWPAVRARNGSPQPWGVKYFQVGNETWFALDALRKEGMANTDIPKHYADCLAAYVDAMRNVDPSIRIIADACNATVAARIHEQIGDRIQYWVQHEYLPWGIESAKLRRAGTPVAPEQLTAEEVWKAWVAIPRSFNGAGESTIGGAAVQAARKYGGKAAITEWNWNGWWREPGAPLDSCFAKAVGAAGYLHAFMRAGRDIEIACQSMTIGHVWGITAIHVDPSGRAPAHMMPTGQVVMFYARHHGSMLLEMEGRDIPCYSQTLTCGGIRPHDKVAYVDALATANAKAVYFHAINRHFSEDVPVTVDFSEFPGLAAEGVQHLFEGRLNDKPDEGEAIGAGSFRDVLLSREGTLLEIVLPKRSVSIVEIGLIHGGRTGTHACSASKE